MSVQSKTTLKTYFVTGASPTEAQFGDLIDSSVNISDDLSSSLSTDSTIKALNLQGAKALKDSIDGVSVRVTALEDSDNAYREDFYDKDEVDAKITSVGDTIDGLPYPGQIAALDASLASLTIEVGNKAASSHTHTIANVTGLQSAIDAKASSADLEAAQSTLESQINAKSDSSHKHVMADITDFDGSGIDLSAYAKVVDLNAKANAEHDHTVSEITDIADSYYNKGEIDVKIDEVGGKHTHLEEDITDLDKYTQAQTNLRISDHSSLLNNPHSVNKAQVSLGNVENLSSVDLFASPASTSYRAGIMSDVDALIDDNKVSLGNHAAATNNPHGVTKAQVSLGNVPNIDVKALLDSHLAEDNPHDIDISFFDVYTKAQSDARVTTGLDSIRYPFIPNNPTDSAGSIGDFTWGADSSGNYKAYLKVAETAWRALNLFSENADGDVDFDYDSNFKENVNVDKDLEVDGKSSLGSVEIQQSEIRSVLNNLILLSEQAKVKVDDDLEVTGELFAAGKVSLGSTLHVDGKVSLASNLNVLGTDITLGEIDIDNSNISASAGDLSLTSDNGIVFVDDVLEVTGKVSLGSTLYVKSNGVFDGTIDVAECGQINNVSICSSTISTTDNSILRLPQSTKVGGDLEVTGNLTIQGTQTILNTTTLDVEDNIVKLNKNVTGTPSADAGIEIERGNQTNSKIYWDESADLWKLNSKGTVKTIAFDEELDALRTNTENDFTNVRVSINTFKTETANEFSNVRASINSFKSTNSEEHSALTELINLRATIVSLNAVKLDLQSQINAIVSDKYSSASGS